MSNFSIEYDTIYQDDLARARLITPNLFLLYPNPKNHPKHIFLGKTISELLHSTKVAWTLKGDNPKEIYVTSATFDLLLKEAHNYTRRTNSLSSSPTGLEIFNIHTAYGTLSIYRNADIPEWIKIIENAQFWDFVETGKVNNIDSLEELKKIFTKT